MRYINNPATIRRILRDEPPEVILENALWQLGNGQWLPVAFITFNGRVIKLELMESTFDTIIAETVRGPNETFAYRLVPKKYDQKFKPIDGS